MEHTAHRSLGNSALVSFCQRTVRMALLAGSVAPLSSCSQEADSSKRHTATSPRLAPPSEQAKEKAPARERSVFDAEPVGPVAESKDFVPLPCATPKLSPAEQKQVSEDPVFAERYQKLQERLELDLHARSLNLSVEPTFMRLSSAGSPAGVIDVGPLVPRYELMLAARGTACSDARDRPRCELELKRQAEAIFEPHRCGPGRECPPFYHVYAQTTQGDEVRTWLDEQGLAKLFGPIDTPMEAYFWLVSQRIFEGYICGEPDYLQYRSTRAGHEVRGAKYTSSCNPLKQEELTYQVDAAGKTTLLSSRVLIEDPERCVVSGRRPPGLRPGSPLASRTDECAVPASQTLGAYLARMAYLEAASVDAFALLELELEHLGAPRRLLELVRSAGAEEVDHAARVSHQAARFGSSVPSPLRESRPLRSRLELALDNAREGCVRELFGAMAMLLQASRAQDPLLRADFARIAQDELGHAELSSLLADWLETGLDEDELQQVHAARSLALRELRGELSEPTLELRHVAGFPSLEEAMLLTSAVEQWSRRGARQHAPGQC